MYCQKEGRELLDIVVIGIALLTIANGAVVVAEQWIPSGLAALIVATLPLFMVVIEALLPHGDKLTLRKSLGIVIGFLGIVLLLWPDLQGQLDHKYLTGVLLILIAPISWSAGSLYAKYRPIKTHPLMAASLQMVVAGMVLLLIGMTTGEFARFEFSKQGLAAIIYLIIFGSIIGYGSYIYALDKLPASIVSMYAYLNPVIAVLLGWLVLGEKLDSFVVLSTIIILFGVLLVKSGSGRTVAFIKGDRKSENNKTGVKQNKARRVKQEFQNVSKN
jgi:drug/metabolite transporter (DMT)-like permease